jgi:hypothetical protein
MTLAEKIYQHSCKLPEQAAREALDFIEFLERRYSEKAAVPAGDTDAFLAATAGKLSDDFPDDITDDDLGTDAPRRDLD